MRKLTLLVAMLMMMLMIAAAPAMAQNDKAAKQAQKAAKAEAKATKTVQESGKKDKATPETGGTLVDASVFGLGAGALLVGSGLVVRRIVR